MDKGRMAELEKIEAHGAENGWVAPMTEEEIQNGVMLLLDFIFPVIHHLTL